MGGSQGKLTEKEIRELQKAAPDFTTEEIRDWFNDYKESCKHGDFLTPAEFKTVYNSVFAGDASGFASHVFRSFDTDRNGKVDFKEFIVGLSISSSMDIEQKLRWSFHLYDIDGNGSISRTELLEIMRTVYKMKVADGKQLDEGLDTAEKMTDKLMEMDLDKNGEISWEEFKTGALNDDLIINLLQIDPDA